LVPRSYDDGVPEYRLEQRRSLRDEKCIYKLRRKYCTEETSRKLRNWILEI
jgi:hypothetical protein